MDYRKGKNRDQLFMTSLESVVSEDSWARVVDIFVDALPIEDFGFKNGQLNREGNIPYHPRDLFKLLIYGYRKRIRSAEQLSEACRINLEVMWLLKGLTPSPRKINYFRSNNAQAIEKAHRHFVKLLQGWQFIDGKVLALDSTKIRGQNSLKNNFNEKKIKRHLKFIDGKISDYLDDLSELEDRKPTALLKEKKEMIMDKIEDLQQRRETYQDLDQMVRQSEDGQISLSDPEAKAVIHHRNIVQVGYNIQTTVDSKNKMVVDVFAGGVTDRSDLGTASKRAQDLLEVETIDLLADAGYHNGAEIAYCERRGVRTFIPPGNHHYQKAEGYRKIDFKYDKENDVYICPAGEQMVHIQTFKKKNSKRKYRVKRYGTPACAGCCFRSECTSSKSGRYIERPMHQEHTERNDRRVKRYPAFYRQRQAIIEHIFGTWKRQWQLTHTILYGKENTVTEYILASIAYNLTRLASIKGKKWMKEQLKGLKNTIICYFNIVMLSGASATQTERQNSSNLTALIACHNSKIWERK